MWGRHFAVDEMDETREIDCSARNDTQRMDFGWMILLRFRISISAVCVGWCELRLLSAVDRPSQNAYMDTTTPRPKTQLGSITDETARTECAKASPCMGITYANGVCVHYMNSTRQNSTFCVNKKNIEDDCFSQAPHTITMARQSHEWQERGKVMEKVRQTFDGFTWQSSTERYRASIVSWSHSQPKDGLHRRRCPTILCCGGIYVHCVSVSFERNMYGHLVPN